MSLIPWRPFASFDDFFGDDDWMVPALQRTEIMKPAMDIYETNDAVVAEVNLPDFDPKDVSVTLEDNMLRVSGVMEKEEEEKKKGYFRKEIRRGSFERAAYIPSPVKEDSVEAEYAKGILKITMHKVSPTKSKAVSVKIKSKE